MILSCWWSNIPDARSKLRFCSFMGWVTRSVTWPASVPWSLMSTTCTMEAHFCVVYSFSNTRWGAKNRNKRNIEHFRYNIHLQFKAFTLNIRLEDCCTHVHIYKDEQQFGMLRRQQKLLVYCCLIYRDTAWPVQPACEAAFTKIPSGTSKSIPTKHPAWLILWFYFDSYC